MRPLKPSSNEARHSTTRSSIKSVRPTQPSLLLHSRWLTYRHLQPSAEIYSLKINKALDSLNALTAKEFHVSAL